MNKEFKHHVSRTAANYGEMGSNPHRKRRGKKRGVKGSKRKRRHATVTVQ